MLKRSEIACDEIILLLITTGDSIATSIKYQQIAIDLAPPAQLAQAYNNMAVLYVVLL